MSGLGIGCKRVVLGLSHGPAPQDAIDAAADFAEFLNIELLAAFVADLTLPTLAEISGARELRILEQGWQAIDRAQITRDIERTVGVARRRFAEGTKSRAMKTAFNIISGTEAIASFIRADDIVVIIEPTHPGERITRQFTALLEAAFEMAGAVLVVPRRIVRTAGPIVTLASTFDDPGIRAALEIAAAFKERLIVVTVAGLRPPIEFLAEAEQLGVQIEHIAAGESPVDVSLLAALGRLRERLRVLSRTVLTDEAAQLFLSLQGIPLLVIEPGRVDARGQQKMKEDRQANPSSG